MTIKRSEVQPTAALMYVESEYIDLSAIGTANSYIVDKGAGLYSFDATVIGNGIYGFIDGVEFHTIHGAGHALDFATSPAEFQSLVKAFLQKYL